MSRKCFVVLMAALVVSGIASTLTVATADELPFKAKLAGNACPDFSGLPIVTNHETGEGEATHLGLFSWEDDEVAIFGPEGATVKGIFTMTAADGDKLYGTLDTIASFDEDGNLLIAGDYTFAGGTGRFEFATGEGKLFAIGYFGPNFPVEGTFEGNIEY
jgi:hypothetical protein